MSSIESTVPRKKSRWRAIAFKCLTWLLSAACFYFVFTKIDAAAARDGLSAWEFLLRFVGDADWLRWLAVMIPYSFFFCAIDANVTFRAVKWFNAPTIRFGSILTIRASAYILSLVNEQVGKGAMSLYLLRRHKVPGWEALSTMIFLGMMEIYQLLLFSSIGMIQFYDEVVAASTFIRLDLILPAVFLFAATYFPIHVLFFRGHLAPQIQWRNIRVLAAFRQAEWKHYGKIVLLKAPNLIGAVFVYTASLSLFQVDVSLGQMLTFLPLIFLAAALPLPFHAGALLLWTVLFPDYPEVGVFSLFMHTFFVLFNAAIGVCFLPKANKELFDESSRRDEAA